MIKNKSIDIYQINIFKVTKMLLIHCFHTNFVFYYFLMRKLFFACFYPDVAVFFCYKRGQIRFEFVEHKPDFREISTIYSRNLSNLILACHSCPSTRAPKLSKKIIITNTLPPVHIFRHRRLELPHPICFIRYQ